MAKLKKIRLDQLLVDRAFFVDKNEALRAILAHEVKVNDVYAASAAQLVSPDADLWVKARKPFVSRGGIKLAGALDFFHQPVEGLRCVDVGSSTGGFTDCLLQRGAQQVTCVDVNYGQLAWEIRQDPRVRVFERTNIKKISPAELGAPFDLIVADLSFIGLASLAEVFARLSYGPDQSRDHALQATIFIGLVKPQFESARGETTKGVVYDQKVKERVVEEVRNALEAVGFTDSSVEKSPITGPSGNEEFFVRALYGGKAEALPPKELVFE